jgi:Tat protein secretion system quality control protein TatD with DNase activity
MIDVHSHIYDKKYKHIIDETADSEMEYIIVSSDSYKNFRKCVELSEKYILHWVYIRIMLIKNQKNLK